MGVPVSVGWEDFALNMLIGSQRFEVSRDVQNKVNLEEFVINTVIQRSRRLARLGDRTRGVVYFVHFVSVLSNVLFYELLG